MKRMFKKPFVLAFLGTVMLVIGWLLLFEHAVKRLNWEVEIAIAELKQQGYLIEYKQMRFRGNPLQAKLIIESPHIKSPSALYEWQGNHLSLSVSLWNLKKINAQLRGKHTLRITSFDPIKSLSLELSDSFLSIYLTSQNKLSGVNLESPEAQFSVLARSPMVLIRNLSLDISQLDQPFKTKVQSLMFVSNLEKLLGVEDKNTPLTLTVNLEMGGLKEGHPLPQTYAEWRDAGGVLDVHALAIDWPTLSLRTNGTLTLDEKMRPLASFTATLTGYDECLALLVKSGAITKKEAKAAAFVFQLLSTQDEAGAHYIKLPITLQDGILSVGPVNLMKLPSLKLQ